MRTPTSIVRRRGGRRRAYVVVSALAAAALTLSACARDSGAAGSSGDSIMIGTIVAETGPIAGAGKTFANGARIAVEQINDGDLMENGRSIELVEKEGSEDPAKSANVAAQLAADPSVVATACCILSTVAGAVKPIAKKNKMPHVLWGATDVGLADPPYVYRTVTMPQPANKQLAKEVADAKNINTVAYGVMTDNSGIVSQAKAFKQGFEAAGAKSAGTVGTLSTTTNFNSAATDLIAKKTDAIVVAGTQSNAVGLIASLHKKGYKGQIVTGETVSGSGVFQSQPRALEGVPFPVYFLASEATGMGKKFADAYQEQFDEAPDDFAAQGYNAIYTIAMGIKAAGDDVTRESLSQALKSMTELEDTIYDGTVTFEDGQLSAESSVKVVSYTAPDGVIALWGPTAK